VAVNYCGAKKSRKVLTLSAYKSQFLKWCCVPASGDSSITFSGLKVHQAAWS